MVMDLSAELGDSEFRVVDRSLWVAPINHCAGFLGNLSVTVSGTWVA
jgi:hypothetical protein